MTVAYSPAPGTVAYRALAHLETLDRGAELSSAQLAEAIRVPPANIPGSLQSALDHRVVFSRKKGGHLRSPAFWSLVDHAVAAVSDKPASLSPAAGNAAPTRAIATEIDIDAVHRRYDNVIDMDARPAGAIPSGDGSQKPDDAAAIPGARAGSNTPQQGANRDASAGQSHVAGGAASPAGRGADGPTARGAAPDLSSYVSAIAERHPPDPAPAAPSRRGLRIAAWSTGELALELADGEVIVFDRPEADQVVAFCRRIGGGA